MYNIIPDYIFRIPVNCWCSFWCVFLGKGTIEESGVYIFIIIEIYHYVYAEQNRPFCTSLSSTKCPKKMHIYKKIIFKKWDLKIRSRYRVKRIFSNYLPTFLSPVNYLFLIYIKLYIERDRHIIYTYKLIKIIIFLALLGNYKLQE